MHIEATRGRSSRSCADIARIAADVGVTVGAIYHHLANEKVFFQTVAEEPEAEILAVEAVVDEVEPWGRVRTGFEKLIDVCASAGAQRIIFVEDPWRSGCLAQNRAGALLSAPCAAFWRH